MSNPTLAIPAWAEQELRSEVARLNKIIEALMDRAERSTNAQGSEFSLFQTTIMLEDQVRRRTAELDAALRQNEATNRALRESEAKFRGVVDQSLVGIAIIQDHKFTYANARFLEISGYNKEEILRLGPLDTVADRDRQLVAEKMRAHLSGQADRGHYEFHVLCKNGVVLEVECHASAMSIGGKSALIAVIRDVTERNRTQRELRALQHKLREQAIHDSLTGLYNRQPLNEFLDRELTLARRHRHPVSVVMGDLDHFKGVNDTYGHLAGDQVLRTFSELLKSSHRVSDIHCRYGGEEFLMVLPDMTNEVARERTEYLRMAVEDKPIVFNTSVIHVTASFGVATFPQHGNTRDALIAAADKALYAAKAGGRNRVISYSEDVAPMADRGYKSTAAE